MQQSKELLPERAENTTEGADNPVPENHMMEERKVTLKLEDGSLIKGKINILSEPTRDFDGFYDKFLDDRVLIIGESVTFLPKGKTPMSWFSMLSWKTKQERY